MMFSNVFEATYSFSCDPKVLKYGQKLNLNQNTLKQREIGRLVAQTQVGEKENCLIERCMRTILLISPAYFSMVRIDCKIK